MINFNNLYYIDYLPKIKNLIAWDDYIYFLKECEKKYYPKYEHKEAHHIIPKSYLPKDLTLEESFIGNKIILSKKDHIKAHAILAKALGGKMLFAYKEMVCKKN